MTNQLPERAESPAAPQQQGNERPAAGRSATRRKVIGAVAVVAAVAAGFVFVTSKDTKKSMKDAAGSVANADEVLAHVERTWRSEVADLPASEANIAADARCYYVSEPTTKLLTGTVACGGIRRVATVVGDGQGDVWDLYRFGPGVLSTVRTPEGLPRVAAQAAQPRPTGPLVRPDGKVPAKDAEALPAPPMPALAADFSQQLASLDGVVVQDAVTLDPKLATITTPAGTFRLTGLGTVASVAPETGEGRPGRAADGYKLRLFSWEFVSGSPVEDADNLAAAPAPAASITLISGTTRKSIGTGDGASVEGKHTNVVSVKNGDEVSLGVGVAQHEQTISVITGKKAPDEAGAIFALANRQVAVNKSIPTFKYEIQQYSVATYDLTVSKVTLTPYDSKRGWAPAGQAWVQVTSSDNMQGGEGSVDYSGWTLTADGKDYKLPADQQTGRTEGTLTFAVPAATRQVSLHAQSRFDIQAYEKPRKTLSPTPLDVTATFS